MNTKNESIYIYKFNWDDWYLMITHKKLYRKYEGLYRNRVIWTPLNHTQISCNTYIHIYFNERDARNTKECIQADLYIHIFKYVYMYIFLFYLNTFIHLNLRMYNWSYWLRMHVCHMTYKCIFMWMFQLKVRDR
jgi:hypothetical protein